MPQWKYRKLSSKQNNSDNGFNYASEPSGSGEKSPTAPSLWSRLFFSWLSGILKLANHGPLQDDDLFTVVDQRFSSQLTEKIRRLWSDELEKSEDSKVTEPHLWKVVLNLIGFNNFFKIMFMFSVQSFCTILQPVFLSLLLSYLMAWGSTQPVYRYKWPPFIYILGLFVCTILQGVANNQWLYHAVIVACNVRTALSGLVFHKVLTTSSNHLSEVTSGHVINLMSKDLEPVLRACINTPFLVFAIVDIVTVSLLAWVLVGWQAVTSVVYVIFVLVLQSALAKKIFEIRSETAQGTDQRLGLMTDIISGIRVLKMNVWEIVFSKKIQEIRRKELKEIRRNNTFQALFRLIQSSYIIVVSFIALSALVFTGHHLTPQNVFTTISLWSSIQIRVTANCSNAIQFCSQTVTSLERMQRFLIKGDDVLSRESRKGVTIAAGRRRHFNSKEETSAKVATTDCERSVDQGRLTKNEKHNDDRAVKDNADKDDSECSNSDGRRLNLPQSNNKEFCVSQDLQEHPNRRQDLQQPVLLLNHISCQWNVYAQTEDLQDIFLRIHGNQLIGVTGPVGAGKSSMLQAIVGEIGLTSGQVISNSRMIYVSQAPWLLGGTIRSNIVFGEPFNHEKYMKCLEVCSLNPDLKLFPQEDLTETGERGVSLSGGQQARISLARAVYSDAGIYLLDDPVSAVDAKIGQQIFNNCICGVLSDRPRILVTHQVRYLKQADHILVMMNGRVTSEGTYEELVRSDKYFASIVETQEVADHDSAAKDVIIHEPSVSGDSVTGNGLEMAKEDKLTGNVSFRTYYNYIRAGSSYLVLLLMAVITFLPDALSVAASFWLAHWSRLADKNLKQKKNMLIYLGLALASIMFYAFRAFLFFSLTVSSSQTLHDRMVLAIVRAPLRFFDTNPVGRILNRVAKDLGIVDESLPCSLIDVLQFGLQTVSVLVVLSVANPWMILAVVPFVFVTLYLARYFNYAQRELSRLMAITSTPLYAHVSNTIRGIVTIRSYEKQRQFLSDFHRFQNKINQAFILTYTASRWLAIRIELLNVAVITSASLLAIWIASDAAVAGISISYALQMMNAVAWLLLLGSMAESQMTSVERVLTYAELPPDPAYYIHGNDLPDNWPSDGAIEFRDTSLCYYPGSPKVLHNLNFTIKPGERVAVVGRTGAGKSSLVSVLSRLYAVSGDILIDGVSINKLNADVSRVAVSVIPQNPMLFTGDLRMNLDPGNIFRDDQLWNVLEQVQLRYLLSDRTEVGNELRCPVTESGSNFSVGERQLICLARALLRDTKIVVLDEATANVDYQTDKILQQVVREELTGRTVLTIAHRLPTVLDYDRVMVLDKGQIVEFANPGQLMSQENSWFASLLRSSKS